MTSLVPGTVADEDGTDSGSGSSDDSRDTSSGRGSSGSRGVDDDGEDRDDREDGDDKASRELRGVARAQADERKNFTEEQRAERATFEEDIEADREACEEEVGSDAERECEEGLREAHKEFNETQREERRDFEEALREEFKEALARVAREPEERLGHFNFTDGAVAGKFVSFKLDLANASLTEVTVSGQLVFDAVRLQGAGAMEEFKIEGAEMEIEFENGEIKIHDNPALALKIEAEDGASGVADFADYLNVTIRGDDDDGDTFLVTDGANLTATLKAEDDSSLAEGNVVSFDEEARFVVHARNEVLGDVSNRHRDDIETAKREGRIGAEVTVLKAKRITFDSVVLDNVTLNASETEDGIRFETSAEGISGRVFIINVERSMVNSDELVLRYYDQLDAMWVEVPIVKAQGGLVDVLNPDDDSTPEYWVVKGEDGWQVIVSVNHWSVHAFTISGATSLLVAAPPSVLFGLAAGVIVSAAAAFNLFRPRKL